MTAKPPLTTTEHITRAKEELAESGRPDHAIAHTLIAIAELMSTNMTDVVIDSVGRGAMAATEAISSILSVVNPGGVPASLYARDNPGPDQPGHIHQDCCK